MLLLSGLYALIEKPNQPETYTITFNSNGGSVVVNQNVKAGQQVIEPKDPVREGYQFKGWYNGDKMYDFTAAVTDNILLVAKWDMQPASSEKPGTTQIPATTETPATTQMPANNLAGTTGTGSEAAQVELAILEAKNDADPAGSVFGVLYAKIKSTTKNSNKITWKKVPGAVKYVIYGAKCGTKIQKIAESKKTSYTHKKLKKGTYYKYLVVAVDANENVLSISKVIHSATDGGKNGNTKKLTLNKGSVTLVPNKDFTLKVKQVAKSKKLKLKNHRPVSFESSNEKVATVTKKGVIKAIGKGKCAIYVYAQNGVYKKVTVTVK